MSRDPSLVAHVLPAHRGLDAVSPYERNATVAVSAAVVDRDALRVLVDVLH
jgi:hypothetical protein